MRACLAIAAFVVAATSVAAQDAFTMKAADGIIVHALRYGAGGKRGVVLAFHMAGSNKAEYAAIAPRLANDGFEVIVVDQRSGGTLWGRQNETVKAIGRSEKYLSALPDLEIAFDTARASAAGRPIVAMGSSYSASLVFLLAAKHPEIAVIASFSPGEYFNGRSVKAAATKSTQSVFVTSASSASEVAAAKTLIDASQATLKQQYVPKVGVHGASILRADENKRGAEAAWTAFEAFLEKAAPGKGTDNVRGTSPRS